MTCDREEGEPAWLVVSDIDDTLTGDDGALDRLCKQMMNLRDRVRFVLNSSRPYVSVSETLSSVFPEGFEPYGVITAMGTEVRVAGEVVEAWRSRFDGWPREAIYNLLKDGGYKPHAEVYQTEHKVSFEVPQGEAQDRVRRDLDAAGLACRVIASGVSDFDILPEGAGKDHATLFLCDYLGVSPSEGLVVAGDSGNDLAMFEVSGRTIAVGNARGELVDRMPKDRSYRASAHHAAGVLEGLRYYGVIDDETEAYEKD